MRLAAGRGAIQRVLAASTGATVGDAIGNYSP